MRFHHIEVNWISYEIFVKAFSSEPTELYEKYNHWIRDYIHNHK